MKYNLPTEYDRRIPKSEDDEPENGITIKSCLYASISINNFFMYMYVWWHRREQTDRYRKEEKKFTGGKVL